MPTTSPATATEIAERAREYSVATLAMNLSLPVLLHPDAPILGLLQAMGETTGDIPIYLQEGSEYVVYSMTAVLGAAGSLHGEIMRDMMSTGMLLGAARIADMIDQAGLRDRGNPLLEFARHFRNACAHGDRWHFQKAEPRHPAACRGLVLSASMHGQKATWVSVTPLLYIQFLDDIRMCFDPSVGPAIVPISGSL